MIRFQITTQRTQEVFLNCTLVGHENIDADLIKEMIEHGEFFLKGSHPMKIVDEMGNPVLLIEEVKASPRECEYNLGDVRVEEMT